MTDRQLSATGPGYAVATPHVLATEAGAAAFAAGGTAVDAALAAAAVLSVVYPHMCAVGGDLFALVARPGESVAAVNGSGAAAAAADAELLRRAGDAMPESGPHTITVPGAVRGWETIAALGGRLPWKDRLAAAVACAEDGVAVASSLAGAIAEDAEALARDPGMRALLLPDGRPLAEGEELRQPALARSLEAIAAGGADALYGGELGDALLRGLRDAGAWLTRDDLAAHATEVGEPLRTAYDGVEVMTSPPNSQGFVLLEVLRALGAVVGPLDPLGPDAPLLAQLCRLANRDRDAHLADPRHARVPLDALLGAEHGAALLAQARSRLAAPRPLELGAPATGDTVAIVTADAEGHAVSLIQSIFRSFGSGILEPATGIVCHSRGSFFSLDPASPNVLAPGKRPGHTLMPVMIARDGRLAGVHGTMGGKAQPQIHLQVLLRHLGGEADLAAVLAAPRWVVGGLDVGSRDDHIRLERSAGEEVAERFRAAGMPVELRSDLDEGVGHAQAIAYRPDGALEAATDPRADGTAAAGPQPGSTA